ncbi:MarR family transcriptional regulator [Aquimarina sp. BL5]|uniref:MarR family winged helix-turn-helix transcriptional regulator n=1 Tax=Aquimarina sp. BL5 TaxID=1714860 RepID=UPI000E4924BF|nr:MarR family transcriptional regulator [Aquimarina sp. BL5]AXT53205.1 MarR family transcriptional regulator [Aquimarina sp. BL5]RKN02873.1 MarR family transcriptional regulator [Aquimarina sp. BL5]
MNIEDIIKTKKELPLSRKAIVNLLYTENWISDHINSELKVYDISIQQFNVLRILKGQEGKPANLSTIQERMVSKMSNTTRLVDKLIKKDLVKRVICESNRRKVEITITEQGYKFLEEVSPAMNNFEKKITSNLSQEELIILNNLLNKLRN